MMKSKFHKLLDKAIGASSTRGTLKAKRDGYNGSKIHRDISASAVSKRPNKSR